MKVYGTKELADLLGVTERTIYNYIKDKELVASKIGRKWIIQEADVKAFLDSKRTDKVD